VGYGESENVLSTENCYLVQCGESVKLPNVGSCSVVLFTDALKMDFIHTKNVADFPPSPPVSGKFMIFSCQ